MNKFIKSIYRAIVPKNVRIIISKSPPPWIKSKLFWTCDWLRGGLVFTPTTIQTCCVFGVLITDPCTNVDEFINNKISEINKFRVKNAVVKNKNDAPEVCGKLCAQFYQTLRHKNNYFLERLVIMPSYKCNLECIYCDQVKKRSNTPNYNIYEILNYLFSQGMVSPTCYVQFAGGEPTIDKYFSKTINLIIKNTNGNKIEVLSNMVKRSDALEQHVNNNRATITCSIDAATKQTYKIIKGIDAFEHVIKNLNYIKNKGNVLLKFIVLENNHFEVIDFLKLGIENGFSKLCIDVDLHNAEGFEDIIVSAVVKFANECKQNKLTPLFGGNILVETRGKNVNTELKKLGFID